MRALGVELDADQRDAIDGHVRLLLAWNRAINLTAIRDPGRIAVAHVLDSLTAVPVLRRHGIDRFVDLGSGGGFPGLPLAVALPARDVLLVDSIGKKVRFLDTTIGATGMAMRVSTFAGRAEALAADPSHRAQWPAVTARAVARLGELVELALPLLQTGGVLVAWKRGELEAELAAAMRATTALGGGSVDTIAVGVDALPGHRLVIVTKTGRTPDAYPRAPATRRQSPW